MSDGTPKRQANALYQQDFKTCLPDLGLRGGIITLTIIGTFALIVGSVLFVFGAEIIEIRERYDDVGA